MSFKTVLPIFRIVRLLRLVEFAKGIRQLLWVLMMSLPALFNTGTLLFMVMFIYPIIGMSAFVHVKRAGELNDTVNFETFFSSLLLLFRLATGSGWNDIMEALLLEPPDCDSSYLNLPHGNCGCFGTVIYLASCIIVVFLVIVNMYVVTVLENDRGFLAISVTLKKRLTAITYHGEPLFAMESSTFQCLSFQNSWLPWINRL